MKLAFLAPLLLLSLTKLSFGQILGLQVEYMNTLSFNFNSEAELNNGIDVFNHASISIASDVSYQVQMSTGTGNLVGPGGSLISVATILMTANPANYGGNANIPLTASLGSNLIQESRSFQVKRNGFQAKNPKDNSCNWQGIPTYPCRTYTFDANCTLTGQFPEAGIYTVTILYTLSPQ